MQPTTGWIGLALGDVTGIGPEVTLKALARELAADDTRYLLIGDAAHLRRLNEQLRLGLPLQPFVESGAPGRVFVHSPLPEALRDSQRSGSPAAAHAAVQWLTEGPRRCLRGGLVAVERAPVSKDAVVGTGKRL